MRVIILKIIYFTFSIALINSCKKKTSLIENTISVVEVESSPRSDSVNGILRSIKEYSVEKGILSFKQMYSRAMFSKELLSPEQFNSQNFADVGNVYLNDVKFDKYGTESIYYGDSYPNYLISPFTWKITGNNVFGSFTYKLEFPHPIFEGYTSLPDSIWINGASELYFLGTDADVIDVEFSCNYSQTIFKIVKSKDGSLLMSSPELRILSDYGISPITVRVNLSKSVVKNFGGKNYKFVMQTTINKKIYPKINP